MSSSQSDKPSVSDEEESSAITLTEETAEVMQSSHGHMTKQKKLGLTKCTISICRHTPTYQVSFSMCIALALLFSGLKLFQPGGVAGCGFSPSDSDCEACQQGFKLS